MLFLLANRHTIKDLEQQTQRINMAKITMETAQKLHEQLRIQIPEYEKYADDCATCLSTIERIPETEFILALRGILQTQLMLCYINLDLFAAYRQYFSTDTSTNYENRQAMTKINIVISEGYKKIYGFSKQQNSFWGLQIKTAVKFLNSHQDEYDKIEEELNNMAKDSVLNKDMRDLAVHYDRDPMAVYKMLSELSAEEVTCRCNQFLAVLQVVTKFVWKLTNQLSAKLGKI